MENVCSVSTTYEWKRVKISQRRNGPRKAPPGGRHPKQLTPWPRRQRLELRVTYRGGSEGWYEVRARGQVWRFPGCLCLEDVLSSIYNDV